MEEKDREGLEVAAMKSGKGVGKREIFITFDTFLARSRPGLGEKEGADSTNKKKKNKKNRRIKQCILQIKSNNRSILAGRFPIQNRHF